MQGCLKPVTAIIPKGSILDPSENAAVVGGNVLTSQRIVDVIFRAFQVCAASQVKIKPLKRSSQCMNICVLACDSVKDDHITLKNVMKYRV